MKNKIYTDHANKETLNSCNNQLVLIVIHLRDKSFPVN